MKPYNNNILVIDDKMSEIEAEIISPLERLEFNVEKQSSPESGLVIASHKFSIIFIDFKFDNSVQYNGATLCDSIRSKCPLSALILLTAYGKENIADFNHASWDGYFEKGTAGVRPSMLDKRIADCLTTAVERRHNKIPLLNIVQSETKMIEEKIKILNNLNQYFANSTTKHITDEKTATALGFKNRAALSQKFTVRNSETGELKKDALVFRHVIMNDPGNWDLAKRHYKPLNDLVKFFSI